MCRSLRLLGAAEGLTGAEVLVEAEAPMGGTLTEAAASAAEAIPVSAEADSLSVDLAVERLCRPPGWAGGTRTRDE